MADRSERTAEEREAARRERERRRAGIFNEPDVFDDFADVGAEDRRPGRTAADSAPAPADPLPPISRQARSQPSRRAAASQTEPPPTEAYEIGDAPDEAFGAGIEGAADVPRGAGDDDDGDGDFEDGPGHHSGGGDDAPLFDDEVPSGTRRVSRLSAEGAARRPPSGRGRGQRSPGRPPRERTAAKRTGRSHSWVGRAVAAVVVLIIAAIVWLAVETYQPFGTSPHGQVTVVVPARSGAHQIGNLLAREGVIPSGFFFELRATLAGDRGKLRSGTYKLQEGMSYGAVLTKLTTPPPVAKTSDLTITPGHTRGQVSALLRKQGLKGYLAATRSSPLLDPHAYGAPRSVHSLEGFLFPDTFRLVDPVKVSALVDDQLRDFKQHFAQVNLGYARSKHLTAYDVLTIASLISGEAATTHDLPIVSSVIYNRLRDGMPLGLDSTTRYATGNFTGPLTDSQLHSPSPYNTRVHTGLPPTPIDSPSLADIQAAAHPAQTNYLYFFTKPCTNRSVFATSYTQFLNLVAADRRTHC